MKKLTLDMEEDDIRLARELAEEQGVSVSAMVAGLVRGLRAQRSADELPPLTRKVLGLAKLPEGSEELPPLTQKLSGILKNVEGKSAQQLLDEALAEKYGLDLH